MPRCWVQIPLASRSSQAMKGSLAPLKPWKKSKMMFITTLALFLSTTNSWCWERRCHREAASTLFGTLSHMVPAELTTQLNSSTW